MQTRQSSAWFAHEPYDRVAGVALPLFSLRENEDLGSGTILDLIPFCDWCVAHGLRIVQLLPLNEAAPEESSPYKAISAFAMDPSYIAVLQLPDIVKSGAAQTWLASEKIQERIAGLRASPVRLRKLSYGIKVRLLEFAYAEFDAAQDSGSHDEFDSFCRQQADWLDEYALFRAISERRRFDDWQSWPAELRGISTVREARGVEPFAARVRFAKYIQWRAWQQWEQARTHARRCGVLIKGDVPFVCGGNSADVWANPSWFDRRSSAGTPPDAFSETGQLWELPVYQWDAIRESDYAWWRRRARQAGQLFDIFRVDHVVGLFRTYAIPVSDHGPSGFVPAVEEVQRRQGDELLRALQEEAGAALVVAEDLGTIPPWVRDSLQTLRMPGYRVFRWEQRDGWFIDPRHYPADSIVTTGTHDTDSLVDWWHSISPEERRRVFDLLAIDQGADLPWQALLRRLLEAPSVMAIFPLQDLLQWTDRINVPATVGPHNWAFRLPGPLAELTKNPSVSTRLAELRRMLAETGRA